MKIMFLLYLALSQLYLCVSGITIAEVTIIGCFNINTGTFGSVKLKEIKIMFLLYLALSQMYLCVFGITIAVIYYPWVLQQ